MEKLANIAYCNGVRHFTGFISNNILLHIAEKIEGRSINSCKKAISAFYKLSYAEQKREQHLRLANIIEFAGNNVPYYSDVFRQNKISAEKIKGYSLRFRYTTTYKRHHPRARLSPFEPVS